VALHHIGTQGVVTFDSWCSVLDFNNEIASSTHHCKSKCLAKNVAQPDLELTQGSKVSRV
jgi:hypothetical protein